MNLRFIRNAGLALALTTTAVTTAHAQFGPFKTPKVSVGLPTDGTDKQTLAEVNRCAQDGMNAMPGTFSDGYDGKAKAMAKAQPHYDKCKSLFSTVVNGDNYEGATRRWKEFQLAFENGTFELEMLRVWEPVHRSHDQSTPVLDADLDAIDAAKKNLDKGLKGEDAKRTKERWKDRVSGLRDKNKQLLKNNEARAAAQASAAATQRKNEVMKQLAELMEKTQKKAAEGKGPLTADELAAFEPLLKEADGFNTKTRVAYGYDLFAFAVYNAWFDASPKDAVTTAMKGTLVSSGTLTAKSNKVKIKGLAETCYVIMGRFPGGTGQEKWDLNRVDDKSYWQRERVYRHESVDFGNNDYSKRWWMDFEGECTTGAHDFQTEVTLEFPGSKTSFEYFVVSWPKKDIPVEVLGEVGVVHNDDCDATHYKEVFTKPFPKLAFYDKEGLPFVFQNYSDFNARTSNLTNPRISTFSATPDKLSVPTHHTIERCIEPWNEPNPTVKAYGQCIVRLEKQYAGQVQSASNAVDSAKTYLGQAQAERRLAGLREAWGQAEASQCGPLLKKVDAQMKQAVTEVADWYLQNKPTFDDSLMRYEQDRVAGLKRFSEN